MLKYPDVKVSGLRTSPTGRTLWCGPFALAVLSGLSYDEVYKKALRAINRRRSRLAKRYGGGFGPKRSVSGISSVSLVACAKPIGLNIVWADRNHPGRGTTVITFTDQHTAPGKAYLVIAGNHYAVIKDGLFYHAHHDPCPPRQMKRYAKTKVTYVAEVKPRPAALAVA